jgi:type IV pilus assembly protein PilB
MAARKRLGEILIQAGVLAEPQLRAALTEQRRWGGPLGRILVDMKLITEEAMVQALSHQLNLPAVNLDVKTIPNEVLELIPGDLAEQLSVVPFAVQGKFLDLAMVDPTNISAIDTLRTRTRLNVRPYLAGPKTIERALAKHYGRGVAGPVGYQTGPAFAVGDDSATPFGGPGTSTPSAPVRGRDTREVAETTAKIADLRARVDRLEALVERDEDVLRQLLALIVEKGIATREELAERLK